MIHFSKRKTQISHSILIRQNFGSRGVNRTCQSMSGEYLEIISSVFLKIKLSYGLPTSSEINKSGVNLN